jgi:hypothetical protein
MSIYMLPIEIKQRILRLGALKELVDIARPRFIYDNDVLHQLKLATLYLQQSSLINLPHRSSFGNTWDRGAFFGDFYGPRKRLVEASDTLFQWESWRYGWMRVTKRAHCIERPSY